MTSNLDKFYLDTTYKSQADFIASTKEEKKNTENLKLRHKYLARGSKMMRLDHEGASLERAALQTCIRVKEKLFCVIM